jgi:hypothetical protein
MNLSSKISLLKKVSVVVSLIYVDMMHMRKQIDEMINLANLRKEKDYINLDIQEMEIRIRQHRKDL